MRVLLIIFILPTISFAQEVVLIQCIDFFYGQKLTSTDIPIANVYLNRYNGGPAEDFGPVDGGVFEIEKGCHRGDKYTIIVDQGKYLGKTYKCSEIQKLKNRFPLFPKEAYTALLKNIENLKTTDFENKKAQYSATAYLGNTLAYLNLRSDSSIYNEASKLTYTSLGEVFDVDQATVYDIEQGLWVPTTALEGAIASYKQENSFKQVNGKADYEFFRILTGLDIMAVKKSAESVYQAIIENGKGIN